MFKLVLPLLKLWKQENQIDGICALDEHLIERENEFSKTQEWAMLPKLTRRKKYDLGQMMVQVKTGLSAMQLHQGQHKMCNENKLKTMSKGTKMEHTTKTGFFRSEFFICHKIMH